MKRNKNITIIKKAYRVFRRNNRCGYTSNVDEALKLTRQSPPS